MATVNVTADKIQGSTLRWKVTTPADPGGNTLIVTFPELNPAVHAQLVSIAGEYNLKDYQTVQNLLNFNTLEAVAGLVDPVFAVTSDGALEFETVASAAGGVLAIEFRHTITQ